MSGQKSLRFPSGGKPEEPTYLSEREDILGIRSRRQCFECRAAHIWKR